MYIRDKAPLKGERNSADRLSEKGWHCIPSVYDDLTVDEIEGVLNILGNLQCAYENRLVSIARSASGVPQEDYDKMAAELEKTKKALKALL